MELSLIEANTKFTSQEQIGEHLRTYLDKMMAGTADRAVNGFVAQFAPTHARITTLLQFFL